MRSICTVCEHNSSCSYIKRGRTGDCIDVQTTEYGYEDAINDVCNWLKKNWRNYVDQDKDGMIRFAGWESDLRNAMLEESLKK